MLGHFGGDVAAGVGIVRGCYRAGLAMRLGEKGRTILDSRRQGLSALLRRHGFRNVGVYHVGGWIHCYYEHNAADLAGAAADLQGEEEFRSAAAEFRGLASGSGKNKKIPAWEQMREVFHTD